MTIFGSKNVKKSQKFSENIKKIGVKLNFLKKISSWLILHNANNTTKNVPYYYTILALISYH